MDLIDLCNELNHRRYFAKLDLAKRRNGDRVSIQAGEGQSIDTLDRKARVEVLSTPSFLHQWKPTRSDEAR
jgi:hypothetical protein